MTYPARRPSGKDWVDLFPSSNRIQSLREPFRGKALNFLGALEKAGARISVACTYRPPERAYLMHYAYQIAKGILNPSQVPPMEGVGISWAHSTAETSRMAAQEMVVAYGIVYAPALVSRHTQGLAIDMSIFWQRALAIPLPGGQIAAVSSLPRSGGNRDLHAVGAKYGVYKLAADPPHWSSDGH